MNDESRLKPATRARIAAAAQRLLGVAFCDAPDFEARDPNGLLSSSCRVTATNPCCSLRTHGHWAPWLSRQGIACAVPPSAAPYRKETCMPLLFNVDQWGSHPDENNDDCWTGEGFTRIEDAVAAFHGEFLDTSTMFIILDGPGVHEERRNPHYRPHRRADDREWQQERAMQAGMAFGVDGYNDEMERGS